MSRTCECDFPAELAIRAGHRGSLDLRLVHRVHTLGHLLGGALDAVQRVHCGEGVLA